MDSNIIEVLNILPALAIALFFAWYDFKHQAQWSAERQELTRQFMTFLDQQSHATLATLDVVSLRLQQMGDAMIGMDERTRRIENAFEHHDERAEDIAVKVEGLRAKMNGKPPVTEVQTTK
jgi:hypothetical protein